MLWTILPKQCQICIYFVISTAFVCTEISGEHWSVCADLHSSAQVLHARPLNCTGAATCCRSSLQTLSLLSWCELILKLRLKWTWEKEKSVHVRVLLGRVAPNPQRLNKTTMSVFVSCLNQKTCDVNPSYGTCGLIRIFSPPFPQLEKHLCKGAQCFSRMPIRTDW